MNVHVKDFDNLIRIQLDPKFIKWICHLCIITFANLYFSKAILCHFFFAAISKSCRYILRFASIRRKLERAHEAHTHISRVFSCTFISFRYLSSTLIDPWIILQLIIIIHWKINEFIVTIIFCNSCPNIARNLSEWRTLINCLDESIKTS